jgi:hypothetical protein
MSAEQVLKDIVESQAIILSKLTEYKQSTDAQIDALSQKLKNTLETTPIIISEPISPTRSTVMFATESDHEFDGCCNKKRPVSILSTSPVPRYPVPPASPTKAAPINALYANRIILTTYPGQVGKLIALLAN